MTRRDELLKCIDDNPVLVPIVDEIVYLEEQLDAFRGMPKIKINPKNPSQQKVLPAAKLYKEYLQQYLNAIKLLEKATGATEGEEESPLRKWVNNHADKRA